MKQPNCSSTPAPRSSAAERWFGHLAKKKNVLLSADALGGFSAWCYCDPSAVVGIHHKVPEYTIVLRGA